MAPPRDSAASWAGLSPPWRCCFELAWESYRAVSLPVGAVVVDPARAIIAFGRNQYVEPNPPAGQLGGTYLAHAEINLTNNCCLACDLQYAEAIDLTRSDRHPR